MDETMPVRCTVVCLAYNHAKYIERALDGFVGQQTNFRFEVIVHDDASTDGTAEIIRDYAKRYCSTIVPIFQRENQWRQGKTLTKTFIYPRIRGEYVAFCEGDDYWTDPLKLQRQVDFLDNHPDYAVCFHPVRVVYEDAKSLEGLFPSAKFRFNRTVFQLEDILKRNFIQTNSVMYRWRFHRDTYDLIPDRILPGDHFLHILHAEVGKIGFLPQVMAVYYKHVGSLWTGARRSPDWFFRKADYVIRFVEATASRYRYCDWEELCFLRTGLEWAIRFNTDKTNIFRFRIEVVTNIIYAIWMVFVSQNKARRESIGRLKALLLILRWSKMTQ